MDRQAHEYAAAMAYAQQQQQHQAGIQQQQHFGFHQQPHQFPQQVHGPPFMPTHPSMQQFPYHIHLPPQQQLYPPHHHPLHQQPPPPYPPHLPPHLTSSPFMHPFESPPPPAMPPSDPELHKRIDKLVEYAAKNGPEFEAMIREKQQDNPDYSFLFGGEGHNYYRYKLWMFTRPPGSGVNPSFPLPSMPTMPPHSPLLNQPAVNTPPLGAVHGPPASLLASPPLHQPSYPPYFDPHQQPSYSQPFLGQGPADYDSTRGFKGLSGPLPSDVAAELNSVLSNLTGTKESIKGAKMWFMQRSPFAPALAEALRERIFTLDDSERQLHIIFLANDILFDSLQRRVNPQDLDNEALAFKPVLGSMLSRIYNNPHNKEANQSRLEKILQFWASKEVYDQPTIASLESEMAGGPPSHSVSQKESVTGQQPSSLWQHPEKPNSVPGSAIQQDPEKQFPAASLPSHFTPTASQPFPSNQLPAGIYAPVVPASFPGSLPISPTGQPIAQPPQVPERAAPPYPLFPPGLIPGMVRKMQIGSGVPYSPMSPLDIPTIIPPSTVTSSEILDRVSKFFKEIGEVNPSEGPMKATQSNPDDDYEEDDYEREKAVRKGGACIPPPANLQPDPETGMYPDGSVDRKGGSGRLGLGATANPNEVSQYDNVYTSYRKQRSTTYHSSMSARASAR